MFLLSRVSVLAKHKLCWRNLKRNNDDDVDDDSFIQTIKHTLSMEGCQQCGNGNNQTGRHSPITYRNNSGTPNRGRHTKEIDNKKGPLRTLRTY